MNAIMTVTGNDHPGIIAAISTALAEMGVNIVNVSQTLMGDYFTMIMQCVLGDGTPDLATIQARMKEAGEKAGVVVHIQSEAIFDAMHRL
ncbi:ACT domain-containing protein [Acidipropionibacterium jensenii]|uniref:ACT domain-containing protein n=1 Tax=Acidipropionibacterium jensenii TaxID=1749 RepID=UPI0026493460|nr:ACT domain-containing protein [Acidipropionibacterium jensenii]MDN5978617.1 ACT domain-containing protein [Acidipropionibacterium jensenii]MDN5997581.1 ACT domain-containing protein [Acidipropionibacterium jensenii]MDN6428136.1 ACT domain-containing protein [Acidipropionibacterium jensenii]MDN6443037.1 ACT domain-containing protein [Acidipropionibacterium jensenii]MDN6481008.1 ACT domain-containing protein [Acidipropionibacterium jensenii]